ncbi:histidine kinase [Roseateles chitinivorans]|uniref:Histidine kinase n=1 Tax=Roseateles chitinivorans TaxID=2917965 RepID=A0A2G9CFN2_9BURK|nr:GAF domain-containing protein [Roseateles chitinivorans]PIM54309.1 histidine kinase [Roseateles chitinivorans]
MMTAPIPANEAERIQALRELLILDTPPEERFDRIVEFAAEEFGVPIALISLVDDNRQWFKARFGLAVCETDRQSSFCGHAIHVSEVTVVPDATQDPRFADNPMVLGPPNIRFYAGAPLEIRPGIRVGTLCLIDRRRRTLDDTDLAILMSLRDVVVSELLGKDAESSP